jgi:hypothetical protein
MNVNVRGKSNTGSKSFPVWILSEQFEHKPASDQTRDYKMRDGDCIESWHDKESCTTHTHTHTHIYYTLPQNTVARLQTDFV